MSRFRFVPARVRRVLRRLRRVAREPGGVSPGGSGGASAPAPALLLLTLLALPLTGCDGAPESAPGAARTPPPHLVAVVTASREAVATRHERPGTLKLRRLVRLFSQEEGRVTRLERFEGDRVAAGDLLVAIEDDLLRAERDKLTASRAQRELDLDRLESLVKRRAASEDELARARTELAVAGAELRVIETRLAFTRITAPFAGVITERLVEPGDFVARNTHLLTLADPDSLVAEALVSELILPHLAVGDPAGIRIDALGGERFDGRILRIHPTLSERDRQGRVEIRFDAIPPGARAGQFVRVELTTAAQPRLLLPFRTLRQDREGSFLWVLDDEDRAQVRRVRTGLRLADRIEIVDGVAPGERVVTRGFLGLAAGKTVSPQNETPGANAARTTEGPVASRH